MARDNRRLGERHQLQIRLLGRMRDVQHDPVPVGLGHHLLAERGEPVPLPHAVGFAGVAVGELVVPVVREREVAGTAVIELPDVGEVFADPVAVLDAHERNLLAALDDATHVGSRIRDLDAVRREFLGEPVHRVELLEIPVERLLVAGRREVLCLADVDGEEDGVEAGVLHLGEIHL